MMALRPLLVDDTMHLKVLHAGFELLSVRVVG